MEHTDYTVLESAYVHCLVEDVKSYIARGWVLAGGIAITYSEAEGKRYYQALTKPPRAVGFVNESSGIS